MIVGVIECYFLIDLLVLDMPTPNEISRAPIILEQPSLANAKANINCKIGIVDIIEGIARFQLIFLNLQTTQVVEMKYIKLWML